MKITRLLIANRGEIARRVERSCRALGIVSIAVYSEIDRDMPFVREADLAVSLGDGTAKDTYLDQKKILAAARATGADAIHPGYGFLSENTAFAAACEAADIIFVGPPATAIELMGDKAAARLHMQKSGVPVLPGFDAKADAERLQQEALRMGFPLLVKPVAGGGGKGMHVVESAAAFMTTLAQAQREAAHAFGDDQVLLERFLPSARHVEMQIFADTHGHCVYLFERDCSLQRRHQKVVEEAPAPGITAALRTRMGEAACAAARSVNYVGAGTVEFLLAPDGQFYFMEMNTRLQVEHPVTEMITGEDLVAWQLCVAGGAPLPKTQAELAIHGHALEVRLYAEDPWQGFLPATGYIRHLRWPTGIRVDAGVEAGNTVTSYYDPMLAKLISHGATRAEARQQLLTALAELEFAGPRHNAGFLHRLLTQADFVAGRMHTRLIDAHPELHTKPAPLPALLALAACLAARHTDTDTDGDPWAALDGWRPLGEHLHQRTLDVDGRSLTVVLRPQSACSDGITHPLRADCHDNQLRLQWGEATFDCRFWRESATQLLLFHQGQDYRIGLVPPGIAAGKKNTSFVAPMSGTVLLHHVAAGVRVNTGDAVVTMEAMKMEHTLRASEAGRVTAFLVDIGSHVEAGRPLVTFTADGDA